jgi:hypothetical protein
MPDTQTPQAARTAAETRKTILEPRRRFIAVTPAASIAPRPYSLAPRDNHPSFGVSLAAFYTGRYACPRSTSGSELDEVLDSAQLAGEGGAAALVSRARGARMTGGHEDRQAFIRLDWRLIAAEEHVEPFGIGHGKGGDCAGGFENGPLLALESVRNEVDGERLVCDEYCGRLLVVGEVQIVDGLRAVQALPLDRSSSAGPVLRNQH